MAKSKTLIYAICYELANVPSFIHAVTAEYRALPMSKREVLTLYGKEKVLDTEFSRKVRHTP